MKTKIQTSSKDKEGFVLLLTLVIVSIILAIGLSMLHITLKQLTLSNLARESEIALHAASAGIECMQYYRSLPSVRQELLNEDSYPGDTSAPNLVCADVLPRVADTDHAFDVSSGKLLYNYQYQYTVDGDKCVETSMYLYDLTDSASDASVAINEGLSEITCEAGSVCTTIFSRGFNRSCDDLDSLFTVQRELTIQY